MFALRKEYSYYIGNILVWIIVITRSYLMYSNINSRKRPKTGCFTLLIFEALLFWLAGWCDIKSTFILYISLMRISSYIFDGHGFILFPCILFIFTVKCGGFLVVSMLSSVAGILWFRYNVVLLSFNYVFLWKIIFMIGEVYRRRSRICKSKIYGGLNIFPWMKWWSLKFILTTIMLICGLVISCSVYRNYFMQLEMLFRLGVWWWWDRNQSRGGSPPGPCTSIWATVVDFWLKKTF